MPPKHSISIGYFLPVEKAKGKLNRCMVWVADRLLGITQLDKLYQLSADNAVSKEQFLEQAISAFDMKIKGGKELKARIPESGPVIIAANHPFGGLEGIAVPKLILEKRPDLKVLVNQSLEILHELRDFFIFTNPLKPNNPKNIQSIKECIRHVDAGGALLVFPAGRVSYFHKEKKRVSEHPWNKIVGRLANGPNVKFLPLFIEGRNSQLFYALGRLYDRLKLIMLPRELLNKRGKTLEVNTGYPISFSGHSKSIHDKKRSQLCRVMSYAQANEWNQPWKPSEITKMMDVAPAPSGSKLQEEILNLDPKHILLDTNSYLAFYANKKQIPKIFAEVARLRELTYRDHEEGSGKPEDSDQFDETYTQLVLFDSAKQKVAGAYRFGQTDLILKDQGIGGLYLNKMFDLQSGFLDPNTPSLEMGRSFLAKDYQRSIHGLHFLWKAIGEYLIRFPRYRRLYGTVSLSKTYDKRSVALIQKAFTENESIAAPRSRFKAKLHPEIADFAAENQLKDFIKPLLQCIEHDGKDIPVLLKHYIGLGAQFHSVGVDESFNNTPGLLLSVDIPNLPEKKAKRYFGEQWETYVGFDSNS